MNKVIVGHSVFKQMEETVKLVFQKLMSKSMETKESLNELEDIISLILSYYVSNATYSHALSATHEESSPNFSHFEKHTKRIDYQN